MAALGFRALVGCLAFVLGATIGGAAMAAPGEDDRPIANPDLPLGCGIDIHVILDESGSILNAGATLDVRRAFGAFTSAVKNTGSRMAVSEFSSVARLPLSGAARTSYTAVTDATIASTFEPYIRNGYNPNGGTHWEDAFRMGRYFLPRPSATTPHLVVFITDGDPNAIVRNDRVTYDPGNPVLALNEYELKVPLDSNSETINANEDPAKNRAVSNANALKAQGSHILSIAVGNGLSSEDSLDRIIDVSGPDVFRGTGTFDLATDDVYRVRIFADLAEAMREAAFQLCAPSVNVRKLVDVDPDPAGEDLQPGEGWSMTATAAPTPAAWVLPAGATGATATAETGPDGFVTFQWATVAPIGSTITVSEAVQPGYFNDPAATRCTYRTPDSPADQPLPGLTATTGGFSGIVPDEAIVTCEMVNRIAPAPAIDIEKSTNGSDADVAPGPFVPVGSPVDWTYRVTNTGNVPLSGIVVTDDQGVTVGCRQRTLAVGQDITCTASGTGVAGQYANTGTVTAIGAGQPVTDSDPSHYLGAAPGVDIEKATNAADADFAPGPPIPVGAPVVWTYVVTNTGNTPLTGVTVADSEGVTVTCPQTTLPVGEAITCTAPAAAAVAGQYENTGSVTALSPTGPVQDSDASHYYGEAPSIDIEKFTNGQDADAPPGPLVGVGESVVWTFRVTNTGNVPLSWSVSDDHFGTPACQRRPIVAPGQTAFCFGPSGSTATAGQYANVGTVRGVSPSGAIVTDQDPSHYFGVQGAIDIEKFTNGINADEPPGPFVPVGGGVTWTYQVTNTGNSALTDVEVVDLRDVPLTCPQTTLAVTESMVCTGTGVAGAGQYTNFAFATALTPLGSRVLDGDPSHLYGAQPGIHLEKATNGADADDAADAPFIPVGDPVAWTYVATNTGNADLTDVAVSDDQGVPVTCRQTTLDIGEEMICTATGTAALGAYENTGSVSGTGPTGATVSDEDPSHYVGSVSEIHVEKLTNGADADDPPGPAIPPGGSVTWTYQVTNPGNVAIRDVNVVDDKGVVPQFTGGDANADTELDPGETWSYRAAGTAGPGQYTNTATVTGLDVLENVLSDRDPSHYHSEPAPPSSSPPELPPNLQLRKVAMRKRVRADSTVRFRLHVRNVGSGTAQGVRVCDRLPAGLTYMAAPGARIRDGRACFTVRTLGPDRSRTFTTRVRAVITERPRTICNVATLSAPGVKPRRARACIRVLPDVGRGRCSARTATAIRDRMYRMAGEPRPAPRAHAAC